MLIVLVSARLILSVVFLVAGLAKLVDREGSRKALVEFGVPEFLAGPGAIFLPIAEVATAMALLPIASAWWGGAGALALLLFFVLGISINLARGRKPDCHCFGQLHSAPAGWSTLGRNAVLACVAGFLAWQGKHNPGASVVAWFGDLTAAQRVGLLVGLAGLALLIAEGALLLQILRQQGRLVLRFESLEARLTGGVVLNTGAEAPRSVAGLPVGSPAPNFYLHGLRGEPLTLDSLVAAGRPVLLLFTNPNCGPCQTLMPDIAQWQRDYAPALFVQLISEGTVDDNLVKSSAYGVSQVLLQKEREVAEAYQAWGTPAAVLVRPDGSVGSLVAQGADAIRALVAQAVSARPTLHSANTGVPANGRDGNGNGSQHTGHPPAAKMGDAAPSLKLEDLRGKPAALADFRGGEVLLLFWNPRCGFCQRMLNDLQQWETDPAPGAPHLVVISSGTANEGRALNLRSTVLLDQNLRIGATLGVHGTPMAVLLDAESRIASEVAAGAEAVFALAGAKRRGTAPTG